MIKPVLLADEKLSYENNKQYENDMELLRVAFKAFKEYKIEEVNAEMLKEFINSYNLIMGKQEYLFTYLFVQFHSDTRRTEIMELAEELLSMDIEFKSKINLFAEAFVAFGKEETIKLIEGDEDLIIWKETFSKILRGQVKTLTEEEAKLRDKFNKEFSKMEMNAEKLGNKPIVKPFVYEDKKYTNDESAVLAVNPTTDREMRKQIYIHNAEDTRDNREEVAKEIAKYANKRIDYLKKFGYESYAQYVAILRDENKDFAKNVMETSRELYKELCSKYVSQLNEYRKETFGWDEIMPWDESAYPSEIVDIPYQEIINFYQNEVKDIFPKESKYIIDNFSKKGTLAILESEHKYNGAAATWTGKNDTYYVTQSYVASNPYSASTLTHEMGHTMHIVAAKLNKPVEEARFSLAIGEGIADTFSMLFALSSMDKNAKYAKTIAYEGLARLLQVTNKFSYLTLAENDLYEKAWEGKEVKAEDIAASAYKQALAFKHDGKPVIVDGVDITKKGNTLSYFSIGNHFTYSSYTISFILAIYLSNQIRKGDTDAFIKILNLGAEEYSTNQVLEMVGIDINSQEIRDVVIQTVEEITNFIIKK